MTPGGTPMTARPQDVTPGQAAHELLEVRYLGVEFTAPDGSALRAVRGVSFTLRRGRRWPSSASPAPASPPRPSR